jgi:hypothetical protein
MVDPRHSQTITREQWPPWNQGHLHRVLTEYVAHYNGARPHRGLGLDTPVPAPAIGGEQVWVGQDAERIERIDVLGGLIHEYSTPPDALPAVA